MTDSTNKSPEALAKELEGLNKELEEMDAAFELLKKSSTPPNAIKKGRFDGERKYVTDEIKKIEGAIRKLESEAPKSKKKIETKEQLLEHIAALHKILSKNIGSNSVADLYVAQTEGLENLANDIRDYKASIDKANPKPVVPNSGAMVRGGPPPFLPLPNTTGRRGPAQTIGSNSGGAMARGGASIPLPPPNTRGPAKNLTKSPLPSTSIPNSGAMARGANIPIPPPNTTGRRGPAQTLGNKAQPIVTTVVNPVANIPETQLIADPSAIRNQILKSLDIIKIAVEKDDFMTAQTLSRDLSTQLKQEIPHFSFLPPDQFLEYLSGKYFAPIKETLNEIEQYKTENKWQELVDANLKLIELHKQAIEGVAADLGKKPGSGTTKDFNQMDRMLISEKGMFYKQNHPFYTISDLIVILTSKDEDEVKKATVKLTTIDERSFKDYFDHANTLLPHKLTDRKILDIVAKLKELKGKIASASGSSSEEKEVSRLTNELTKELQDNLKSNKEDPAFKKMLFSYNGSLLVSELEKTAGVQPDEFQAAKAKVTKEFDSSPDRPSLSKETKNLITWKVPQLISNKEPINNLTKLNELLVTTKHIGRRSVLEAQKLQAQKEIASNSAVDGPIDDIKKMFGQQFDVSTGKTDALTLLNYPSNWNAVRTCLNSQATRYFEAAKKSKAGASTGASATATAGKTTKTAAELPPEFLFLNDFEIEQIPFPGTKAKSPATQIYTGLGGLEKYDFCLMPDSVKQDPDSNAELGQFYLLGDGSFIVRDSNGKAQSGNINVPTDSGIDMSDLQKKLNDPQFKESILEITSKQGFTNEDPIKIEYTEGSDFFGLGDKKGAEIKENLQFALISKGQIITQDEELFNELLNINSTPKNNKFRNIFMMALATGYLEVGVDPNSTAAGITAMTKTLTTDKTKLDSNKNLRLVTVNDSNFDAFFDMVKAASKQISVKDNIPKDDVDFEASLKDGLKYLLENATLQPVPGDEERKGYFIHPEAWAHNQNVKERNEKDKKKVALKKAIKKPAKKGAGTDNSGGSNNDGTENAENTIDTEEIQNLQKGIEASKDRILELEQQMERVEKLRDTDLAQFNKENGTDILINGPTELSRLKEQIRLDKKTLKMMEATNLLSKETLSASGHTALKSMSRGMTFLKDTVETKTAEVEAEKAKNERLVNVPEEIFAEWKSQKTLLPIDLKKKVAAKAEDEDEYKTIIGTLCGKISAQPGGKGVVLNIGRETTPYDELKKSVSSTKRL